MFWTCPESWQWHWQGWSSCKPQTAPHRIPVEHSLWITPLTVPSGTQGIHPPRHCWFLSDDGKKHFTSLKGPSVLLEQTLQGPHWHSVLWLGLWAGYAAYIGHSQKRGESPYATKTRSSLMSQLWGSFLWPVSCELGPIVPCIIAGHYSPSQHHLLKPSDLCLVVAANLRKEY